jgi:putative ABC transport system ATP-binding protein
MNQIDLNNKPEKLLIDCKNLSRLFRRKNEDIHALSDISLQIFQGDFVTIAGKNGSGKSTLLGIMSGMERPTTGSIIFDTLEMGHATEPELARLRSKSFGFIFQDFNLLKGFTVYENIEVAAIHGSLSETECRTRISYLLDLLKISHRSSHFPAELSAGEQQRIAIARALVNKPPLLFADEPTAEVDPSVAQDIAKLLIDLNLQERMTVVMATHNTFDYTAARQFFLREGKLVTQSEAGY